MPLRRRSRVSSCALASLYLFMFSWSCNAMLPLFMAYTIVGTLIFTTIVMPCCLAVNLSEVEPVVIILESLSAKPNLFNISLNFVYNAINWGIFSQRDLYGSNLLISSMRYIRVVLLSS